MYVLSVVRGLLIRLLHAFALPEVQPPVWYRTYLPLIFLLVFLPGAVVMLTWGVNLLMTIVSAPAPPPAADKISPGVGAALVVAWLALLLTLLTLGNLAIPQLRKAPLVLAVPGTDYSWLVGVVAVGFGLLIGTSIFR